jgi:hypothetical protein
VAGLSFTAAPTILVNLTNQTVVVGSSVTLGVLADGAGPLSYQWLFNGAALPSAGGAALALTNITSALAGIYQVMITNAVGSVMSDPAVVTVLSPPVIVVDLTNKSVLSGSGVVFQVQASGTGPLSYQWQYNGVAIPGATSNVLALAAVTSSQSGTYQVLVQNASGSAESALASLQVVDPTPLRIDPVDGSVFKLTFRAAPGQAYTVQYSRRFEFLDQLGVNCC